jgi:F-type H+-transporting ATPase subunit a
VPKRKILGITMPVWAIIAVFIIILSVISLLAGAVGSSIVGDIGLPDWLIIDQPHPELPPGEVFNLLGMPVTNTMIGAWMSILVLGLLFWAATRKMKIVPGRLQTFAEFIIGWLLNFCTDIAGEKNGRRFFPIVATIFLFVIANAWLSLLPGYGSILVTDTHGEAVHLFRGANTDINLPLALALVSFVMVEFWGVRAIGVTKYLKKFFNFSPLISSIRNVFAGKVKQGLSGMFEGVIRAFIGMIELLSEFVRILSFTFRLFGNMTGGEILLLMIAYMAPFVILIPLYGLELLVGFIQALIFGGLTLVFAMIAVTPHAEEEH